jgi:hypothetical protein
MERLRSIERIRMPSSPIRRQMLRGAAVAVVLSMSLSGCSVVDGLQRAGEELQRRVGDMLGGDDSVSDVVDQSEKLCFAVFEKWTGGSYEEQPALEFGCHPPSRVGWLADVASVSGEAYLGDDDTLWADEVHAACVPIFEAWTGGAYDSVPDFDYGFYVVPTIRSRMTSYEGVCTIYRLGGSQIFGSARGAGAAGA